MTLKNIILKKQISTYNLSKISSIPYMTLNDLINNKTKLNKCNSETVYKLAKALNVSMEELLEPYLKDRPDFELFKSSVCHRLKELGDISFIANLLDSDEIMEYYNLEWYPECLYLLAMLDYISRLNNIPKCANFDSIRSIKLSSIIYPASVIALSLADGNDNAKKQAWDNSIYEFKRFNIVENEVRDIV